MEEQVVDQVSEDTQEAPQPIEIRDIGHFMFLLLQWHQHKLQTLDHLQSIPDGTEVSLYDSHTDEEVNVVLTGDCRVAFIAGLSSAISEFNTLPFHMGGTENDPSKLN